MIKSILPVSERFVNIGFVQLSYLLALFPLLPYGARSAVTIIWALLGLDLYLKERKLNLVQIKRNRKIFVFTILPFVCLLTSVFYSKNFGEGLDKLVQVSSLLIYPLIFFLNTNKFDRKRREKIIIIFCVSVVLLVTYQILMSINNRTFLLEDLSQREIQRNNLSSYDTIDAEIKNTIKLRRFRNYVVNLVNVHTTYQGLWISFVLFLLFKHVPSKKNKNRIIRYTLLIILGGFLFFWLLLLSTRMPILAILLGGLLTIILFTKLSWKTYLLAFGFTGFIAIGSYLTVDSIRLRVDEVFKTKFALPSKGNDIETYNSTNVRNGVYYCSFKVIKDDILFGLGLGDVQDGLDNCYRKDLKAKIYRWTTYNTHNQYLFFLLSSGFLGLIAFLISIYIQFRVALRRKLSQYFYFLTIVSIVFLTENVLLRSDGLIFYSFFSALFLFNSEILINDNS
ncbi:O-antigen ligase family protein [Flagellimonas meridianipacifica]|uniref:O-antigen ligase-like membrane protein n=1 Tax=Flagellimonas meridianipacifica TaxID=1080225 RepID=A0A2T0MHC1_9FLAO|nr:O-antigen ligase family protein [Allomuricauda pacifica]PRX56936.1 O-antigen ligase-like membrane protein [Allomuricauda pacifica]